MPSTRSSCALTCVIVWFAPISSGSVLLLVRSIASVAASSVLPSLISGIASRTTSTTNAPAAINAAICPADTGPPRIHGTGYSVHGSWVLVRLPPGRVPDRVTPRGPENASPAAVAGRYTWAMAHDDGPGRRVLSGPGGTAADVLAALPGADLTTVQLEVARRRAKRLAPADVLRRHRDDRFVAASPLPFASLRRIEDALLGTASGFDLVTLAPVVPLGTHSVVTGLAQHRVVPTGRGTEVAADPTTGLALEAAVRRASASVVRLATVQRVVRAQRVDGAVMFAHFSLFGAVTAGRDTGD